MRMRLLFAEDDRSLCRAVQTILEHAGYGVDVVYDGSDALDYAREGNYDGIILDWMMPGLSGLEALSQMRRSGVTTPCLMLTARDAVEDRVTGLNTGADDYLPKPFDTGELLARIRAMLRRKDDFRPDTLRFADIELDRQRMTLTRDGQSVRLSKKAFQLMEMLMEQPRRVHDVNRILERIWGWDSESDFNAVWVAVSNLRRTLKDLNAGVEIRATRGVGYSLEETR